MSKDNETEAERLQRVEAATEQLTEAQQKLVVGIEDGVYIYSPEMNPAGPEEAQNIEHCDRILENTGKTSIDIKMVGGFSKEGIQFMANIAKVSSIELTDDQEKLTKQNFMNLKDFEDLGYKITNVEDPEMKTKCSIISKGDEVYVSFRGTKNMRNVATDLNAVLSTCDFMEGRAHSGFQNAFEGLWPKVADNLQNIADEQGKELKDLDYKFAGHSMGGAVAKIAAMYVNKEYGAEKIGVVTFGDPRVFDSVQAKEYEKKLGENTVRIVQHHKDPIPAVATGSMGYKHVGCQIRVEAQEGVLHSLSGYKYGVDKIDDKGMVENKSVSIFYQPSKFLRKLNEKTIGKIQQMVKNFRSKAGHETWSQKEAKRMEANRTEALKNNTKNTGYQR